MQLWINWICISLLSLTPLLAHLLIRKPRSESLAYDLAGLIGDPPTDEPEEIKKSFAEIQPINDIELSVEDIQQCLKMSRDLSRPHHAAKCAAPVDLAKIESKDTKMSANAVAESLAAPVNLAKETSRKAVVEPMLQEVEIPKVQEVKTKQEPENAIRPSRTKTVQQSTANHNGNHRHSHVRNLDAVLEIQASRRSRHL